MYSCMLCGVYDIKVRPVCVMSIGGVGLIVQLSSTIMVYPRVHQVQAFNTGGNRTRLNVVVPAEGSPKVITALEEGHTARTTVVVWSRRRTC